MRPLQLDLILVGGSRAVRLLKSSAALRVPTFTPRLRLPGIKSGDRFRCLVADYSAPHWFESSRPDRGRTDRYWRVPSSRVGVSPAAVTYSASRTTSGW